MGRGQGGGGGGGARLAGGGTQRLSSSGPRLSQSDIATIQLYAGNVNYQNINGYLNGTLEAKLRAQGIPEGLIKQTMAKAKADYEKVAAVLETLPSYKGDVYRTLHFESPRFEQFGDLSLSQAGKAFVDSHVVGSTVQYPGFTSTSKAKTTPYFSYQRDTQPYNVRLKVKSKTGRDVSSYSSKPNEKEVTFRANTQFRVVSKSQRKNGGWDITLEEL